ncbi:MAG: choline dehydrogenase [Alphaproteobacteria bacterium]|nr:choline dehydrogenase [Alphaproteobacteria bacterium]
MAGEAEFDFIIIGAGSAGCVLANRLSSDPANRVLVIEAGPEDRGWKIHMPAALAEPMKDTQYNWWYETEPQQNLDGRRVYWPRGRVLGGSSSINGMVYVRGHALDYDRWAGEGARGWSYADVLPYFRKAQTHESGPDSYRGGDGPLRVRTGAAVNPLHCAWLKAGRQAGYPISEDMNGYQQEGLAHMQMTVHKGRRQSTAVTYLRPVMGRPNLTVVTEAMTDRIVVHSRCAVGVEYRRWGSRTLARATREVIVASGSINGPQLLMLSGIGNADDLRPLGIPVVHHLPGVGANLQDHLECYVQYACTQPVTLYPVLKPLGRLRVGIEWLLFNSGLGASNHFEAGGFIRSRAGVQHPDLQYHFFPMVKKYYDTEAATGHGFQAHIGPMRSPSRGYLKLRSANPDEHPIIDPRYMSEPADWEEFRAGVRLTREIFAQTAFDPFRGAELQPGPHVTSDADIDAFLRKHAESAYHPCGTCKMGVDPMAVVDPECRVHGLEALRVVDASIMPSVPSGNLNAPTIMIGEKAADMILGRPALPPSNAPTWVNPDWRTKQR